MDHYSSLDDFFFFFFWNTFRASCITTSQSSRLSFIQKRKVAPPIQRYCRCRLIYLFLFESHAWISVVITSPPFISCSASDTIKLRRACSEITQTLPAQDVLLFVSMRFIFLFLFHSFDLISFVSVQFLFDAFLSLIKKGKKSNIVSVMPKKPVVPPRAQVRAPQPYALRERERERDVDPIQLKYKLGLGSNLMCLWYVSGFLRHIMFYVASSWLFKVVEVITKRTLDWFWVQIPEPQSCLCWALS